MSSEEKRNKFFDADDSDDGAGHDHDSQDDLQKGGRSAKRRRVNDDESDAEDFSDEEEEQRESGGATVREGTTESGGGAEEKEEAQKRSKDKKTKSTAELPGVSKPLTKKNLVATEAAIKKSGVVYLSRIPPFMKPAKLRSLLEPYGKINRIFLSPEDPAEHARRVRNGGNKKRLYTEGWVEFVRKKDAKKACDLLNAQIIGGKKSSWYHDDVWALKYLKGFKWHHLTEQIAAENAERASRMRAEIAKTTRENKEFVRNVEKAKVLNGIQAKAAAKRKKSENEGEGSSGEDVADKSDSGPTQERRRTFKQIPLAKKRKQEEPPEQVRRVLSKIF